MKNDKKCGEEEEQPKEESLVEQIYRDLIEYEMLPGWLKNHKKDGDDEEVTN